MALELFHGLLVEREILHSLLRIIVVALACLYLCIYFLPQVSILQDECVILVLEDRVFALDRQLETSCHFDDRVGREEIHLSGLRRLGNRYTIFPHEVILIAALPCAAITIEVRLVILILR